MTNTGRIEIPLSKSKLIKNLLGSIVFVVAGLWLLIFQPSVSNSVFNSPLVKYGGGILAVLFGALGIIYFSKKLTDKKPGLIIDEKGVVDNASAVAAGFIPWSDIDHIETAKVMKQEFLMLIVKNPGDYLSKQKNMLKRKSMEMNLKHYGSPITISTHGLKYDMDQLKIIMDNSLALFRKRPE